MRLAHKHLRMFLVLLPLVMLSGVTLWQATGIDSPAQASNRSQANESAAKNHLTAMAIQLKQAIVADQEQPSGESKMALLRAQANYDQAVATRVTEIRDRLAQVFPGKSILSAKRSAANLPQSEFREEAEALLGELQSYRVTPVRHSPAVEASSREMDIALAKSKPVATSADVAGVSKAFKSYSKTVKRRIAEIEKRINELEANKASSDLFSSDPEENKRLEGEYDSLTEEREQLRDELNSYKKKHDQVKIQATGAVIVSAGATLVSESCSPPNGAVDPSETVTVSFCVQNTGANDTVNLVGTLQATGGVFSPSGPQNYGVVVAGGPPVCRNFTFTSAGVCGGTITASIQFQDGVDNLGTVTYTFTLGVAGPAVTRSFTFSPGVAIPDGNAVGVNIPFTVSGVGSIADLNFRIDGTSCNTTNPSLTVGVDHSWVGDLKFTLTSPGSTSVVLMNRPGLAPFGSSGNNFCQTLLDDDGAFTNIQSIQSPDAPFTGTFNPQNPLSAFDGQNADGTWTLNVSDNGAGDTGFVQAFSLIFQSITCCAPPPGTCVLTCPANITKVNDPNQCGAVVTYPAPTSTGTCGTITCSPPSGMFYPKGTTTVTCTATAGPSCPFTITVNDTQPPVITCPGTQTKSSDPNQCGAVVTYLPPVVSDNCPGVGTPTCSPASGLFFPKGSTTVTCTVADASGNTATCSFMVNVNDTQPPTITCGLNLTAKTPTLNDPCALVSFSTPVTSDNCPGSTVACSPPSGSCFAVGVTTVTCTSTDVSGNTATCSFAVTVFNVCLQDDSVPATVFLGNTLTGDYRFCCEGTIFTGKAQVIRRGNTVTFSSVIPGRRVQALDDESVFRGTASVQTPPGTTKCTITDKDTRNNSCICP